MKSSPRRHRPPWVGGLVVVVAVAASGGTASAAADPLLVIVESAPGVGIEAAAVRRSIEKELSRKVVAPFDPAAGQATQVLLVALDGRRITISLHSADAGSPERSIAAPREATADLRAISWLAGNLARDQVGPIIASPALPATATTAAANGTATAANPAPPAAPPATPPPLPVPDMSSQAYPANELESVRANASVTAGGGASLWTISASGGPALAVTGSADQGIYGTAYSIALQRESVVDGLIGGATIDVGPSGAGHGLEHYLGVAAIGGSRWIRRRWYFEATAGIGLEIVQALVVTSTLTDSSLEGPVKTTSVTEGARPAFYARAVATVAIPLRGAFDLTASLAAHVTSTGTDFDFLTPSIGLRLRIP
jgi:hypothetical protein